MKSDHCNTMTVIKNKIILFKDILILDDEIHSLKLLAMSEK